MEQTFQDFLLTQISDRNPLHFKKVRRNIRAMSEDAEFVKASTLFYQRYERFLINIGQTRSYAVDSYLRMIDDVMAERLAFESTGEYSNKTFEEVNRKVYANPEVMNYHMHALLLTQYIWSHHYEVLKFYVNNLDRFSRAVHSYLEIGGGHGLYVNEAVLHFRESMRFDVVDISESSLDIARNFVVSSNVNYILQDIFEFEADRKYDFITMGEVLEHVEDPVALLRKLHDLLNDGGRVFITTPANAPAIDHIFLFRNADEIRKVISQAGFDVEEEKCVYAENIPQEMADRLKITMMYAAFLKKR